MHRSSGGTPGIRTNMPRRASPSSTARAKAPSRPQSTATKLVAEGRAVRPFVAAIRPTPSRAAAMRFRIGHMGHVSAHSLLGTLATVEAGLRAIGAPIGDGAVDAAAAVVAERA